MMVENILKKIKIFSKKSVEERLPDQHCVVALIKKFEQTGSVLD